jgi:diguanylate cyclase (GGDEF)-like protein
MNTAVKSLAVRSLVVRYVAGLAIIAILSLAVYFSFHDLLEAGQATAATVNISGRQRMLTQKAALLSLQLMNTADSARRTVLRGELHRTVLQLHEAHHALLHGNPGLGLTGDLSPEVRAMFLEPPLKIEETLIIYLQAVTELANAPDGDLRAQDYRLEKIAAMAAVFVENMNDVVGRIQAESEAREQKMKSMAAVALSVMLFVLVLEYLFIFQPAARTIRSEAERLAVANAELMRLSGVDGLTGIANRRLFDDFFSGEWKRAIRAEQPLTVIMADVDHFKLYNDNYGHRAGDECLRKVAAAMGGVVKRTTDLLARYGGEEFVVVLAATDAAGAITVAVRLLSAVEEMKIPHAASPVAPVVTISLGVATVWPRPGDEPHEVVARADTALYQAKKHGRNRVVIAHGSAETNRGRENDGQG